MEKWPEQDNKLTKKDYQCVVVAWSAVIWLFCFCLPFQKDEQLVDNMIMYWIPWFYAFIIVSMFIIRKDH